jgi:hypothetical protein
MGKELEQVRESVQRELAAARAAQEFQIKTLQDELERSKAHAAQESLKEELRALREEVRNSKAVPQAPAAELGLISQLASLQGEVGSLRLNASQGEVQRVHAELAALREELRALKPGSAAAPELGMISQLASLQGEVGSLRLNASQGEVQRVHAELAALREELRGLRGAPSPAPAEPPPAETPEIHLRRAPAPRHAAGDPFAAMRQFLDETKD